MVATTTSRTASKDRVTRIEKQQAAKWRHARLSKRSRSACVSYRIGDAAQKQRDARCGCEHGSGRGMTAVSRCCSSETRKQYVFGM